MRKNNYFVLTGGPGAGKSAIIQALAQRGFATAEEAGRKIIRERIAQKQIGQILSPRPDPALFGRLMLEQDSQNYLDFIDHAGIVFFDRSVIDSLAYLEQEQAIQADVVHDTLNNYGYNKTAFIAAPWLEIYRQDSERDQSFETASATYSYLKSWYQSAGYQLVELPKCRIEQRVQFILQQLSFFV